MKYCALLALLLVLGCVHVRAAPLEGDSRVEGSCEDPQALAAAEQALIKINQDRQEGYVFALQRLSNVHYTRHDENGVVFYLNLEVAETNCSVLSKRHWKTCETRVSMTEYGVCKAAIFINRVQRVVRLYKYVCEIRPVPAARLIQQCPDCPSYAAFDSEPVRSLVSASLEKFNKESSLSKLFTLGKVTRATSGYAMSMYYHVDYTIQETVCPKNAEVLTAESCPPMQCEFAHKGFCKASVYTNPMNEAQVSVECEIFEPEAAEREKKSHELGGQTDHDHAGTAHTHEAGHDQAHAADAGHSHDHAHDHTKPHDVHESTHVHPDGSLHHHTHDHAPGSGHSHHHAHSHDHGHNHDHVHAHHAKAHDHTADSPNHHHNYQHTDGAHTHDHDHELALDHDHKHPHLHEHEHHHHHHEHQHEITAHDEPQGEVRRLPALGLPAIMPSFPDVPAAGPVVGVVLPLKPDPQIPGAMEPTILPFPTAYSAQCSAPAPVSLVDQLFSEDPLFRPAA
ncbi:fetuin B [Nelusetta ayraudi]|uniref:fetuin B n=1 Tax=Nelusetta ayraudi TaxID=303726 RepID=UPI003F70C9D7